MGKARRWFDQWWNRDKIEAAQVEICKQRKKDAQKGQRKNELRFVQTEKLKDDRLRALLVREELGMVSSNGPRI